MSLFKRHILLGVTGSIAAYKSAELIRLLMKAGAEVRVVMTDAATAFIGKITFQALSGYPVYQALFDERKETSIGHVQLARWADFIIIAPASANFLARIVQGHGNDLLTAVCLAAASTPIALAPAMNQQMWTNQATRANVDILKKRKILIWGPQLGEQACGDMGPGCILGTIHLFQNIDTHFKTNTGLNGIRTLVTAGPTREVIDPVRFISNRSSGKMGFAVAKALSDQGAHVTLISGPVILKVPRYVKFFSVESAQEMHDAVMSHIKDIELFVATAAVTDYRPARLSTEKIKKEKTSLNIRLIRNPDILAEVASLSKTPFLVGFAAETKCIEDYAEKKRLAKRIDMIAVNDIRSNEGGFEQDKNALTVIWEGGRKKLPMMPKNKLAYQLVKLISERMHATR